MVTEEQVRETLEKVLVPGTKRSPVRLNLVRGITVSNERVNITLASAALNPAAQMWLKAKVGDAIQKLPGVKGVDIAFAEAQPKEINEVRSVIAVMSGKGGVGKSVVSALIAIALARQGMEVGILDADITGPSIPRMFGLRDVRPLGSESGILPVPTRLGIQVMSLNLLLEHEDDAVIWRGPIIATTIKQFWEDVLWGSLDYLIVDLPPGTSDAPLTVMQSLPLSGVVIVFSPQDLAAMVVRKAVKMARDAMHIPILGVVENMSYLVLPDTGKKLELFGPSKGQEMARAAGAPLLGQLPIDPELARLCDEGNIERYDSEVVNSFAQAFLQAISAKAK